MLSKSSEAVAHFAAVTFCQSPVMRVEADSRPLTGEASACSVMFHCDNNLCPSSDIEATLSDPFLWMMSRVGNPHIQGTCISLSTLVMVPKDRLLASMAGGQARKELYASVPACHLRRVSGRLHQPLFRSKKVDMDNNMSWYRSRSVPIQLQILGRSIRQQRLKQLVKVFLQIRRLTSPWDATQADVIPAGPILQKPGKKILIHVVYKLTLLQILINL
ncbi:Hypothetical predicted protein [Pelobates cultripes]|uniref:Uncharacterized protein n=1 Tax=Pelobates cultripes TaxID=61616 RepID=A0AAD1T414_PELCU|nr:Hypothetical predicted protein [Pelobates cultripes]